MANWSRVARQAISNAVIKTTLKCTCGSSWVMNGMQQSAQHAKQAAWPTAAVVAACVHAQDAAEESRGDICRALQVSGLVLLLVSRLLGSY